MRKIYKPDWGSLLNKKTRTYLIKTIPLDFYQTFARQMVENGFVEWKHFNTIYCGWEGTIGWNNFLYKTCTTNWRWIYDLTKRLNWIDYDLLSGDILFHMCRLYKLGKLNN